MLQVNETTTNQSFTPLAAAAAEGFFCLINPYYYAKNCNSEKIDFSAFSSLSGRYYGQGSWVDYVQTARRIASLFRFDFSSKRGSRMVHDLSLFGTGCNEHGAKGTFRESDLLISPSQNRFFGKYAEEVRIDRAAHEQRFCFPSFRSVVRQYPIERTPCFSPFIRSFIPGRLPTFLTNTVARHGYNLNPVRAAGFYDSQIKEAGLLKQGETLNAQADRTPWSLSNTTTNYTRSRVLPLVLDWVSVRYTECDLKLEDWAGDLDSGSSVKVLGGHYTVTVRPVGSRHYTHSGLVNFQGVNVARFVFGARTASHENTLTLTLENSIFYDEKYRKIGYCALLGGIASALQCASPKLSRVDLAVDGVGTFDIIQQYNDGRVTKRGRACLEDKDGDFRGTYNFKRKRFEGYNLGSRAAGRYYREYNKTHELKKSQKQYIHDFHEKSGVTPDAKSGCIFRSEMEIKTEFFKRYATDFCLADLDNFDKLKSLYHLAATQGDFLGFSVATEKKNKSRDAKHFNLIDSLGFVEGTFSRGVRAVSDGLRSAKMAIKRLFMEASTSTCPAEEFTFRDTALSIARKRGIESWLQTKFHFWLNDLEINAFVDGQSASSITAPRNWQPLFPYDDTLQTVSVLSSPLNSWSSPFPNALDLNPHISF